MITAKAKKMATNTGMVMEREPIGGTMAKENIIVVTAARVQLAGGRSSLCLQHSLGLSWEGLPLKG